MRATQPRQQSTSPLGAHVERVSGNRREFFARSTMALGSTVGFGAVGTGQPVSGGAITPARDPSASGFHCDGSDRIRIGLIGCGARGKAAAIEAITASRYRTTGQPDAVTQGAGGGVHLVAMADTSASQLQAAYRTIKGRHRDCVDVDNRRFVGPEGWRGVLASDVDLVILATPAEFRPTHFEAAIEAGKHVFMECPIAVDMAGVQRVAAAGTRAKQSGRAVAVGHQRRHERRTRECVAKLREGILGDLIYARTYSSDLLDDRHVHSLDVVNWVLGSTPLTAQGFIEAGATGSAYQLIEFAYANDFPVISQCRKTRGGRQYGEHFHGTLGTCDVARAAIRDRSGKLVWQSEAKEIPGKGWQRQFNELIASLRAGEFPFELDQGIASTSATLLGQLAVQSG